MKLQNKKNRWLIVLCAVAIHISIGSVYAFSVITDPLKIIFEVDGSAVKWAFKITILVMGFAAALLGPWVAKVGPNVSIKLAGLCYGLGILGSGLAVHLESLLLFYLFYGLIAGVGLGIGYITPVGVLIKWFPDKRGLATGIVIMAFGFASLIFGPLMQYLFDTIGVTNTFYTLGFIYMIFIITAAIYIEEPPENYRPSGFEPSHQKKRHIDLSNSTAKEALRTSRFYYIWFMMFIGISCGIAVIADASQITQEYLNYTPMQAAGIVGLIGAFNGLGRLFWSSFSDYFGRSVTFIIFFLIQMTAFFFLAQIGSEVLFLAVLMIIITIYGGAFATLPVFLSDLFGTKDLATILGMVLISKGFAGLVGPSIYDYIKTTTGSLDITLKVFSGLFLLAFVVSIIMQRSILKLRKNLPRASTL